MAAGACDVVRAALAAWATQDLHPVRGLPAAKAEIDALDADLLAGILEVEGPAAAQVAVSAVVAGRSLERIADHAVIVAERLRWLLTGDPAHLASEVR
jgi:phosphate transport system protein